MAAAEHVVTAEATTAEFNHSAQCCRFDFMSSSWFTGSSVCHAEQTGSLLCKCWHAYIQHQPLQPGKHTCLQRPYLLAGIVLQFQLQLVVLAGLLWVGVPPTAVAAAGAELASAAAAAAASLPKDQ
jgi:hypothetical protein